MAAEELGFLSKGHRFQRDRAEAIPNRSGSAPPSMEGSLSAIGNILSQQYSSMRTSSTNLRNTVENVQSEELYSDPVYLAYYFANMNLNVRPPPHHVVGSSTNWRLTSLDDSGNGSIRSIRTNLKSPISASALKSTSSAFGMAGQKKVEVFDSEELLAVQLAKYTAELSDKFAKERGAFTVVLSGGSLIKALRKLCEAPYVDSVEWGKWHVFWVDERVVPKDRSNAGEASLGRPCVQ